jgi:hypothetical protein
MDVQPRVARYPCLLLWIVLRLGFFMMVEILLTPQRRMLPLHSFHSSMTAINNRDVSHTLLTYICMCSDLVCSNTILHINARLCQISGPGPEPGNYMIP